MNDRRQGQPPTESMLPKVLSSFFSTECELAHLRGSLLTNRTRIPQRKALGICRIDLSMRSNTKVSLSGAYIHADN